jgi:hypothetical protein
MLYVPILMTCAAIMVTVIAIRRASDFGKVSTGKNSAGLFVRRASLEQGGCHRVSGERLQT